MNSLRDRYNKLSGQHARLLQDTKDSRRKLRLLRKDVDNHIEARKLLTHVGKITQDKFKRRVESLVTLAISSVFDRPFEFELIYQEKANQITCTPVVKEGNLVLLPKDEMGAGIIDIASFALRVVLWSMESPKSINVFILDEPFKWTGALLYKAGEMLRYLSSELNFQVVLISHDDDLIATCDRVWRVTHDGTKSKVTLIKGRKILRRGKS